MGFEPVLAGTLDRKIVFEMKTPSKNSLGTPIQTWAYFASVWASYVETSGSIDWTKEGPQAKQIFTFITRWRNDLSTLTGFNARIKYSGNIYMITNITEIGRKDGLRFSCEHYDGLQYAS
jgi:head-tail adaptor